MNENINLVDILKDCPKGTKLYSTIYGEVEFKKIITDNNDDYPFNYPIVFIYKDIAGNRDMGHVTKDGKYNNVYCGECTLFPSKYQRDWSKFSVEPEMVDGEIYYTQTGLVEWIYIYKKNNTFKTNHYVAVLNNYLMEFNNICTTHDEDIKVLRKVTEEEKQSFFEAIEKNGRKWDSIKKELVRIEPKFDISTLKPFDKVLVRDVNIGIWEINYFSRYSPNAKDYPFICLTDNYFQCIPYNEETKHLVGTTKMPPKKYITWGGE